MSRGGPGPEVHVPRGTSGVDPRAPDPLPGRSSKILGAGGRGPWVALGSTLIFFGLITLLVVSSPGWSKPGGVRDLFFDGALFRGSIWEILQGFVVNVEIFLIAEVLILILALFLAVLRSLPGAVSAPLRLLAIGYSIVFRAVPTILIIFLLGFGMPALELRGLPNGPNADIFWAIVALMLVYSAYVMEVYRAGIESVHPSQAAAARSLGLRRGQALRYVVLPQAVRRVIPPLLNDFIGLQKDSALVALLGVTEGLRQAQIEQATYFNFTPYMSLALVYLVLTLPQVLFVDWLIKRGVRRRAAGAVT
ncbi:MAG: amino acid ABC transporter permease [Actinomycetota bacterium]